MFVNFDKSNTLYYFDVVIFHTPNQLVIAKNTKLLYLPTFLLKPRIALILLGECGVGASKNNSS